jgi:hypothetical protein
VPSFNTSLASKIFLWFFDNMFLICSGSLENWNEWREKLKQKITNELRAALAVFSCRHK